jgi:hypothetical protein
MAAVIVDMTAGPDMTARQPNGVACGTSKCSVGQSCCVLIDNGQVTSATCIARGGPCSGSRVDCDGPEDCGSDKDYCCATITLLLPDPDAGTSGGVSGGEATCTPTCNASVDFNGPSLTSRLCGSAADCTGLSVAVPVIGSLPLDKCCSSSVAPGTHFCGSAVLGQFGVPITCS